MTWLEYIVNIAAPHSRHDAKLWFRYLRKYINKNISEEQINELCNCTALSVFQRISFKEAFTEGTPTREYINSLNKKVIPKKLLMVMEKYDN